MVTGRSAPLAGLVFLLCLSACADLWRFHNLKNEVAGDASLDAIAGPAGDDANSSAVPTSDGGSCTMCGGQCIDVTTDLGNCGGCNNHCLVSEVCQEGTCVCTANQTLCGTGTSAACVDLMTDHGNCGSCGNSCGVGTACQGGRCVCPGLEKFCGTGTDAACVVLTSDHANCGGCGNGCVTNGMCQQGVCGCPSGQQACGTGASASCVDTTTDHNNCGGCGTVCPNQQTCQNSRCVPCATIGPSGTMCGTPLMCVDTATDHGNCGGCGQPCRSTEVCQGAKCVCPAGETLCGSGTAQGCVALASDQNNCGACGTRCTGGMTCTNSACACPTGYHSCSGTCVPDGSTSTSSCGTSCSLCPAPINGTASCTGTPPACGQACSSGAMPTLCGKGAGATCVNTTNDAANCGACGNACSRNKASEACVNSKCTIVACAPGWADCDQNPANGCEVDTTSNAGNCGACGQACNMTGGTEACVTGQCTGPRCDLPMADCDHSPANGCEVDTSTDKNHCGSCTNVCPTGTNCSGGGCTNCPSGTMQCGGNCASCPPRPANGTLMCAGTSCVAACGKGSFPTLCGTGGSAACVNTQTDNGNCGACGSPCSVATSTNKCEQTYACQAGTCTGSNPVACPAASDACHTAGTCNPSTGVCSAPTQNADSTPCTGPNKCDTYACLGGVCTGTAAVTCTASDACHVPGKCAPGNGMCTPQKLQQDGTMCSGPNACDTYTCMSGVCMGSNAVTCTPSDGCHVAGTCNSTTGACSNPAAPDGTMCNGTNACLTYACASGVCTGSHPGTCAASDQCHVAGMCNPMTGSCSNPAATNGTACSDGNACTLSDTCQSGACASGTSVACAAMDGCHVAGMCDPVSGKCSNPTAMDGTQCTGAASGTTCRGGLCQCPLGTTICTVNGSPTCVDLTRDPNNCGACNTVCSSPDAGGPPTCSTGACIQ